MGEYSTFAMSGRVHLIFFWLRNGTARPLLPVFRLRVLPNDQKGKLALLSIAHRFNFSGIFKATLKGINVNNMSVLDKIRLGDKYDMNEWLLSAYIDIIDRAPELTWNEEEAEVLGLGRVNRLLRAKNFMLHERLKRLETCTNSYYNLTSTCAKCTGSGYFYYSETISNRTTPTKEIVKKYFPNNYTGAS